MNSRVQGSVTLLVLAGATELVVFADGRGVIRIGLALLFLLLVPGWALLRIISLDLPLSARIGMSIGIGISVEMLIATLLLYARLWSMELAMTAIVAIVVAAVLLELPGARGAVRRARRRASATWEEIRGG